MTTWSPPSWSLLIPPVLLTFQSTLCQFQQTQSLRLFRLSLLPICIYAVWIACDTLFTPARDFVLFNIIIHLTKTWTCLRSIELATARERYMWIGYMAAYRDKPTSSEDEAQMDNPTVKGAITYGVRSLCSLRGIGWSWGIRGKQVPAPYAASSFLSALLTMLAWTQALTVASIASVKAIRSSHAAGHSVIYQAPASATIFACEKYLLVLAVGLATFAALEMGFAGLTLAAWLVNRILRTMLPQNIAPPPFEPKAWPRLMRDPIRSTSLHEFWGIRWHSLFRRVFLHDGAVPASALARYMGLGRSVQQAAAAFGAFFISGLLHEAFSDATPWLPRDPEYRTMKFFILQPFGMMAESIFTKATGKRVSGPCGFVWTFAFLLLTGHLMARCWVQRGIVDFMPVVTQWEWWRWILPFGIMFPPLKSQ